MKKIKHSISILLIVSLTIIHTGCIGSFRLTNHVLDFNRGLGDPIVEELVFLGFLIIPVYEVTTLLDALLFNTIEFWTGNNPLSYHNENNEEIRITKEKDSYQIKNLTTREEACVYYQKNDQSVYLSSADTTVKLVSYHTAQSSAVVYLPNGLQITHPIHNSSLLLKKHIRLAIQN